MTAIATPPARAYSVPKSELDTIDTAAVVAEEYALRVADIDPDPAQPRLDVDDELAGSIKEHGILKAIEVRPHPDQPDRYMIVDGERRWRGAQRAGLAVIPAKVTLDAEGVNIADRMVRQIVHNTGKPLTPVEEALAFKKIIEARRQGTPVPMTESELRHRTENERRANIVTRYLDANPKYGPVQLAKDLGLPKSTVTDRLAMTEIPDFWLPLIVNGPLQPSHVPILHRWRKVPEKFQLRALEKMKQGYRWPGGSGQYTKYKQAERIYVQDFERELRDAMYSYVRPLSEVPGYNGPTEKLEARQSYPRRVVVHAMDPTLWQPIARKKAAERAKKRKAAGGSSAAGQSTWQKQEAERQRRYQLQQQREEREFKALSAARPKILAAFAAAVAGANHAVLRDFILAEARPHRAKSDALKVAAKANTPEAFMRAFSTVIITAALTDRWSMLRELPKLAKRWKVDVAKLAKVDAEDPEDEAPDPATTDPGEDGDGRMAVDDDEGAADE